MFSLTTDSNSSCGDETIERGSSFGSFAQKRLNGVFRQREGAGGRAPTPREMTKGNVVELSRLTRGKGFTTSVNGICVQGGVDSKTT